MADYLTLNTNRLHLVPTTGRDAGFLRELLNTPKWLRFIGDRRVQNKDDAIAYIRERMLPQLERLGFGNFTVLRKADGVKMGCCGLYDRPGLEGLDLGYAFLPEYEGFGYAYESAKRVQRAAHEDFGRRQLEAITSADNFASQRLLDKLDFTFQGKITLPDDDELLWRYNWRHPG